MQERPYQQKAHAEIEKALDQNTYHQLVSMATGTGKTILFSQLPKRLKNKLPGQMMVFAHRDELLDQAIYKIRQANPELRVDKEKAEHRADPSVADVIVASIATVGKKNTTRLDKYNWGNFDKFVTDECHHSVSDTYLNIYDKAGIYQPGSKKLHIGFTATHERGDGKALAKLYDKIVFNYPLRKAIEDGWLVDVRGIRVNTNTDLDKVKITAGDFNEKSLAETINTPARNQRVVKAYLEAGEERQAIGFTVDIKHAQDLAEMFREYDIPAEAVWGNDPLRAYKIQQFRDSNIRVLFNCGILTEGFDMWQVSCVILARPTKSSVLFAQMIGRGTRLEEGTGNLLDWSGHPIKKDCIVIDIVDTCKRHNLITLPTLVGLGSINLNGKSLVKSVQEIEASQTLYPDLDFSSLSDINELEAFIEQFSLFETKIPEEANANSIMSWHRAPTGGYILMLPNKEFVKISENMLDKWDIYAIIKGQAYKGERATMEDAFGTADKLIKDVAPNLLTLVKKEATWRDLPPKPGQLSLLKKLLKGKPLPNNLTRGSASRMIGNFLAGKG